MHGPIIFFIVAPLITDVLFDSCTAVHINIADMGTSLSDIIEAWNHDYLMMRNAWVHHSVNIVPTLVENS